MAKKTYLNVSGERFVGELVDGSVSSKNGMDQGFLFRIMDKEGNVVGCITAFISITTKAVWKNSESLTPELTEKLFLRIFPHIPFGMGLSEIKKVYSVCIQLFITPEEATYDKVRKIQYVKSWENPYNLVEHLVFNGSVDDDKVEKDILSYLYEKHLEDRTRLEDTSHIAKALFIDEDKVFRCLDYIEDDG